MVNLLVLLSVGLWVASLLAARLGAAVITHCVIADNMMQCVMIVKRFFVFLIIIEIHDPLKAKIRRPCLLMMKPVGLHRMACTSLVELRVAGERRLWPIVHPLAAGYSRPFLTIATSSQMPMMAAARKPIIPINEMP
jgi:hypothetical protein